MGSNIDINLWSVVVGFLVLAFTGGIVWGSHKHQLNEHQKNIDKCDISKLMTEEKCKEFYRVHYESTENQLNNIASMLAEMKIDRKDMDVRLGALTSRLDVLCDRWERANG